MMSMYKSINGMKDFPFMIVARNGRKSATSSTMAGVPAAMMRAQASAQD
jgi:hypothetical protein